MTDDALYRIDLAKLLDLQPKQLEVSYRDYVKGGTSRPGMEEPSLIEPAGELATARPGGVTQSAVDTAAVAASPELPAEAEAGTVMASAPGGPKRAGAEVSQAASLAAAEPAEASPASGEPSQTRPEAARRATTAGAVETSGALQEAALLAATEAATVQGAAVQVATEVPAMATPTAGIPSAGSVSETQVPPGVRTTGS